MTDEIIFLFANACSVYLICGCAKILFDYKPNQLQQRVVGAGYYLETSIWYLLFPAVWVRIVSNLVGIFLFNCVFTKSVKKNLFVTSVLFFMEMGCDLLSGVLLSVCPYRQMGYNLLPIMSFCLLLMCKGLIEKIVNQQNNQNEVRNIALIIVPLCSIGVILLLLYGHWDSQTNLLIFSGGLLAINFVNLWLYNMLVIAFRERCVREILEQKLEIYSNQLKVIQQSQKQIRQLRHDMKHHLGELRFLAEQNDIESLKNYLIQMERSVCNQEEYVSSGNTEIDSVLNYMLASAKRELKEVHSKVQIPEKLERTFDISIILGNLLENAIDAAKETEQQFLDMEIGYSKGVLRIRIENSYRGELKRKGKKFLTTKLLKEDHGIGLQSVQQIVEKYHGEFEVHTNELFGINVILYL